MSDTNRPDTSHTHTMTDENTTEADPVTDSTFDKETIKRLGQRGTDVIEHEHKRVDPDTMEQGKDVTLLPFCNCGDPINDLGNVYRCCRCDDIACSNCRIRLTRRTYCPNCATHEYNVSKSVFISLYLLDNNELTAADLFQHHLADTAAAALLEHNYLQLDAAVHDPEFAEDGAIAIDNDDPLSVTGKEALHVGEQLYGEDEDVNRLMEDLTIQQVANNGR